MPATIAPLGIEVGLAYEILGPDGTRAVLNDSTDPDWVGFTNGDGVTGLERAGVRESADVLPEADGGVHGAFLRDRLAFTLQGIIPPEELGALSWLQRQDRLLRATDALRADAELRWTPTLYGAEVRVRFRQQQPTRLTGRRPKAFIVTGVSEDPTVEALLEQVASIVPDVVAAGGFTSPLTSPLTSTPSAPNGAIVSNRGRSEAWPLLRVYGPCSGITLRNATVDAELILNYTLNAGEYLELESSPRRRRIRLMGTANRYSALDSGRSTWWPLQPGNNDVRVGMTTFSAGALVEVHYRDTWG